MYLKILTGTARERANGNSVKLQSSCGRVAVHSHMGSVKVPYMALISVAYFHTVLTFLDALVGWLHKKYWIDVMGCWPDSDARCICIDNVTGRIVQTSGCLS